LLEECLGCGPSLVDKAIKDRARETGPDILSALPSVLLEIGSKVRLAQPENPEISLVLFGVLRETHAIQVLGVEPVDIRVRIPWVTRPPIHFTPVDRPEIRHDVEVVLRNITSDVFVEDSGHKGRFHY
jgi:hypothetical protein